MEFPGQAAPLISNATRNNLDVRACTLGIVGAAPAAVPVDPPTFIGVGLAIAPQPLPADRRRPEPVTVEPEAAHAPANG
jgi:hypothetical protein